MSNTAAWLPSSYSFLTCLCMAERGVNIWCTKAWTCLPHTHRGSVSLYNSRINTQDRALLPVSPCPDYLCCLLHYVIIVYPSSSFLILCKTSLKLLYVTQYSLDNCSLLSCESSEWAAICQLNAVQPPVRELLMQTLKTKHYYSLVLQ